jgi:hypothetical protein
MTSLEILKAVEEQEEWTHLWLEDGSGYPKEYIKESIEELENFINNANKMQKDIQRLKILFDSEFYRCSKCGEYKRSGFGCYCENV